MNALKTPRKMPPEGSANCSSSQTKLTENPQSEGTEANAKAKKKRKKKVGTKEERLRKREEKKFNEIYAPKGTKISVISSDVLERFRKGVSISVSQSQPKQSNPRTFEPLVVTPALAWPNSKVNRTWGQLQNSKDSIDFEFPALGSTPHPLVASTPLHPTKIKIQKVEQSEESRDSVKFDLIHTATPVTDSDLSFSTPVPIVTSTFISKGRSRKPLVVGIADFLSLREKRGDESASAVDGTPKSKQRVRKFRQKDENLQKSGNILDSSAPIVTHRGKIRKPKQKKPTLLKRTILTSRALRKVTIGVHFGPGQNLSLPITMQTVDKSISIKAEHLPSISGSLILTNRPVFQSGSSEIKIEGADLDAAENKNEQFFRMLIESSIKAAEIETKVLQVPVDIFTEVKRQLHTRKFRTYCDMYVTKELHGCVIELLKSMHRFQDKLYHTDPVKYKTKKRYVIGLKNIKSYLAMNKVQLVIIAPDLEMCNVEGGLEEKVEEIIELAKSLKIPYIFSGHRYILGYPVFIKTSVAGIGLLDCQGGEDLLGKVLEGAEILREKYKADFDQRVQDLCKAEAETYPRTTSVS